MDSLAADVPLQKPKGNISVYGLVPAGMPYSIEYRTAVSHTV